MIKAPCSRPSGKDKCAVIAIFLLAACPLLAKEPWRLLIEPTYLHNEAEWPIDKAERTVLVPARVVDGEIVPLKKSQVLAENVTRKAILEEAPQAAADVLAKLKPQYVRDDNNVIQYVVLQSDSQLTASAVLAPGFSKLFTDTLGDDVLVAIPSRYSIFVFPRLSDAYKRAADAVTLEYASSPYPVSKELFTFRKGQLTAVGSYQ